MDRSHRALVAIVATATFCFAAVAPALAGGNVTVKNLSTRQAAVVVEVTTDHGSKHWVQAKSFCLRPGETSKTYYTHMDLFRVRAELRKAGDCATPNVQGAIVSAVYRTAIPTGSGLMGPSFEKPGWLQNHDVIIESGKYAYSWTVRVVNNK